MPPNSVEVIRTVLANSILRKQKETIEATQKALEAAERERGELRARLAKLEILNGNPVPMANRPTNRS